jgi:hypothetical protein
VKFVQHPLAVSEVPDTLTARVMKVAYVFLPFAEMSVHAKVDSGLSQSSKVVSMSDQQKTTIVRARSRRE